MANEKLQYSELTDKVYITNSKGLKIDVTDNFHQIMLSWICKGKLPSVGKSKTKVLKSDNIVHFEITLDRKAE